MARRRSRPTAGRNIPDDAIETAKRQSIFGGTTGYKSPPQHTRFKKGQSGNPKGRPKTSGVLSSDNPSVGSRLLMAMQKPVKVREDGKTIEIPVFDALLQSTIKSGFSGNSHSQRYLLEKTDQALAEHRLAIEAANATWELIAAEHREKYDEAARKGEESPRLFPHPDDIIIDYDKGPRIIGPINEEEARKFDETVKLRDTLLLQSVFEDRLAGLEEPEPNAPLLFATMLNTLLPPRYRLSDIDIQMKLWRLDCMSKRDLLKTVRKTWWSLGARARRGATLPPQSWAQGMLEVIFDFINDVRADDCDIMDHARQFQTLIQQGLARRTAAS